MLHAFDDQDALPREPEEYESEQHREIEVWESLSCGPVDLRLRPKIEALHERSEVTRERMRDAREDYGAQV